MKKLLVLLALPLLSGLAFAQVDPSKPMITGKGNVTARPGAVIITNQTKPATAPEADKVVELTKFEVTGSLLRSGAKTAAPAKR